MTDATGVAEAMLGLPGFRVLEVDESDAEVVIRIETIPELVGCAECGVVAVAQDRMAVEYRDLAAFGRPTRLVWIKRRWRCEEPRCIARTWTETSPWFSARCLLTDRAGAECCRQVGRNARPVTQMAAELAVSWDTVMDAVREHGEPLVNDPDRIGMVTALGVDETTFLAANREHPTLFATGMVDLRRRVVIDVVEGNSGEDLGSWLDAQPPAWCEQVRVVATDLAESYRAGLEGRLDHAIRVADPFHVVRVANRCLDKVRRRVQNATLGHRGRKRDPLYRIRKLMLTGSERLEGQGLERMLLGLRLGDPEGEVLGAWVASQLVAGERIADRLVSIADPDARPIRKGKLRQPTEFGYVLPLAALTESTRRGARGLILPAATRIGAAAESDLLPGTGAEVARLGLRPAEVALDGGFWPSGVAEHLPGVQRTFIAGRQSAGSRRTNRRLARYRVGCEGRISHLKRRCGLRRSRLRGHEGARTWVAWAILAYNLDTLAIRGS